MWITRKKNLMYLSWSLFYLNHVHLIQKKIYRVIYMTNSYISSHTFVHVLVVLPILSHEDIAVALEINWLLSNPEYWHQVYIFIYSIYIYIYIYILCYDNDDCSRQQRNTTGWWICWYAIIFILLLLLSLLLLLLMILKWIRKKLQFKTTINLNHSLQILDTV